MHKKILTIKTAKGDEFKLPVFHVHTLIIGSGAAGLNCALQLKSNGIDDILVLTEGLQMGTSINTGSDKQTYYKLSLCGEELDAPAIMARNYFEGGGMHGDLALVEAGLSVQAFTNLVQLGVPFPRDKYGQFVGYKTDHDPRQRATSIGPYTSREMCRCLIREVKNRDIPIREKRLAVSLLTLDQDGQKRAAGAVVLDENANFEVYAAENVVFAVGGPGGLYKTSVYPEVHTGAIGLALMSGAEAQNLSESQFGLASTRFRWNVSGSYMQVIPRFISAAGDGISDEKEFLREYFSSAGEMNSTVFLKGYQWPFDSNKVVDGSSIIDVLVYIETMIKGRRVFLDFRKDPDDFDIHELSAECLEYLTNCNALSAKPIDRLIVMNPSAIELYREHGIDIEHGPLEIAVCAQHNNGGLAANIWWESTNIKHLFPVGEVNGSHGVYRPGGAALNAGQVGGFRAADFISHCYHNETIDHEILQKIISTEMCELLAWLKKCKSAPTSWTQERDEFQTRMSHEGAHIRSLEGLTQAVADAWKQSRRIETHACSYKVLSGLKEAFKNRYLCFAHAVYLEAVRYAVECGVGSRGSAIVLDKTGASVHPRLDDKWRFVPENKEFRQKVLETQILDNKATNSWIKRRPIPQSDTWFETAWAAYQSGAIYRDDSA